MESKKIKVVLSTLYGTMASSPGTCKDGNSIGFRPILTNATPGFVYADTDSIHCDLEPDQIRGIMVHNRTFCFWEAVNQSARKQCDSVYEMR